MQLQIRKFLYLFVFVNTVRPLFRYIVPLATVPMAYYLAYVPHFIKFGILALNTGTEYPNEAPREAKLQEMKYLPGFMVRAKAAHINCLEMFPMYAAAVLIARVHKADPQELAKLCARYLALRVVYIFLYMFGVNKFVAAMRTMCWGTMFALMGQIAGLGL